MSIKAGQVASNGAQENAFSPNKFNDTNHIEPASGQLVIRHILGFEPTSREVADLINSHTKAEVVGGLDTAFTFPSNDVVDGRECPNIAYERLLVTRNSTGGHIDKMLDWLAKMYEQDAAIELRALRPDGQSGAAAIIETIGKGRELLRAFIKRHDGRMNLYVGINPRKPDLIGRTTAANKSGVADWRYAVLDFDHKDAPETDKHWLNTVSALINDEPLQVVQSGNGTHVWFRLSPAKPKQFDIVQKELKEAMKAIGADNIADAPRIIRLPYSINIPTPTKRNPSRKGQRPAVMALALPAGTTHLESKLRSATELNAYLKKRAADLGQYASGSVDQPAVHSIYSAPTREQLEEVLRLIPNDDDVGRDRFIAVAHAVKNSAVGTDFEIEARQYFLDWAGTWSGGSNPKEDERVYDTLSNSKTGFSDLEWILQQTDPDAFSKYSLAKAKKLFAATPINLDQVASHQNKESKVEAGKSGSAAARAAELFSNDGGVCFPDSKGRKWAELEGRLYKLDSTSDLENLAGWFAMTKKVVLVEKSLKELQQLLKAATYGVSAQDVYFRQVQSSPGDPPAAYLNRMDEMQTAYVIEKGTWSTNKISELPFKMAKRVGSLPMIDAVAGKSNGNFLDALDPHAPMTTVQNRADPTDRGVQQRAITVAFVMAQIYRPGTVPILMITGGEGAGKTTFARKLVELLDPDTVGVATNLPADPTDASAIVSERTCRVLDNQSGLSRATMDLLCGFASGTASERRALYQNEDRHVSKAHVSTIISTIAISNKLNEDFVSRTLQMELDSIPSGARKPEAEMKRLWNMDKPGVMALMLDMAAGALTKLEDVRLLHDAGILPPTPRLMDAVLVAEAACQHLGWRPGLCIEAIAKLASGLTEDELYNNPVAVRVRGLIDNNSPAQWEGTIGELIAAINFIEGPAWLHRGQITPQLISSLLRRCETNMREIWGIEVLDIGRSSRGARKLIKYTNSKRES